MAEMMTSVAAMHHIVGNLQMVEMTALHRRMIRQQRPMIALCALLPAPEASSLLWPRILLGSPAAARLPHWKEIATPRHGGARVPLHFLPSAR